MTNKRNTVSTRKRSCAGTGPRLERKQTKPMGTRETGSASATSWREYEAVLLINWITYEDDVLFGRNDPVVGALRRSGGLHSQMLLACSDKRVHQYEWSMQMQDYTQFYQTSLVPLCDAQGRISQVLSLTRDITSAGAAAEAALPLLREGPCAKTFAQMLLAAREEEKKAICKTLHDELGSSAVMLSALLRVAQQSIEKGSRKQALADLAAFQTQLQQSWERMKNVIVTLRPPSLEQDGALGGSIQELLQNISRYLQIPYTFNYSQEMSERGISDNVKILLYRVAQEALSNIAKHARAKHITAELLKDGSDLHLTIADDGVGFTPSAHRSISHIGLLAMKDNVRLLGGRISIKSAPGKGTRIQVTCPCVVYEVRG